MQISMELQTDGVHAATGRLGDDVARRVLESLPDAALLLAPDGCVIWGNPAAEALFGVPFEDGVGRNGLDFVHPDDLPMALLSMDSVQRKGLGTLLELRMRHAGGEWRLMEIRGAVVDAGVVLCVRDLTERRRWEVVGDETSRFRSLLQSSSTLMVVMEGDGTVTGSSGALSRLLGRDPGWLEARHLSALVDPLDHVVLDEALATVRADGSSPVTVDLRLVDATGSSVPFAVTLSNLLDDPTVGGIVATGHDVSDRVSAEHELRSANSLLAATLESTAEGILVVDLEGRVTSCNRRFLEMWRLSDDVVERDDPMLAEAMLSQLRDPSGFVGKVRELDASPQAASRDRIDFLDDRVYERDSLPQRIDGEVVGRVWSFRDMTEQVRLQGELAHQAFHDPLTGLANQALFRDRVTLAAARLARHGGELAVLFIDLDDFKTVNDSLGHSAGDQLLVGVSERLMSCVRPGDTVARLGGDEFAVLIDELVGPDDAVGVAERIVQVLQRPVSVAGAQVSAAASIGIAYGGASAGVDDLLRNADLAMYTAKGSGKNCHRVFADEMHDAAVERLDLEARLRGAAGRGELMVHYQPIVELATGRIAAMEALVRWDHPERGLLGPTSFIPFAEEGGLIDEIGHHVLVTACEQACEWSARVGASAPAINVNISPRQLSDPTLPERVADLLAGNGLAPSQLVLEITEGALMKDPVAATASLRRLRRSGVRLAVDDFGTGYSSLSYLRQFPVDVLKIDGAFVDDELVASRWSLAQAILQISHALGLVAIAEEVEDAEQAAALAANGCELAQGYHFGRPVDAAAAMELVLAGASAPPPS
jgi:diguanylate cyclase (GGDEF)-like protein/PAS domain S-box-containing protein